LKKIIKSSEIYAAVKPYLPTNPIIVEAGSFMGHDTMRLAQHWPAGNVHAFEPIPELFEKLKSKTADTATIHCYPLALSNHDGTATMHVAEKPDKPGITTQASSLHTPRERLIYSPIEYPHTILVPTITLDTWANQHRIDHIDFLWLDMQGHELSALKGAAKILPTVRAIYTEVNFIQAYEGQPLDHVVSAWITAQGFKEICRTFENRTDWFFGEILFVRV
jgi:FkbM family methyltransferase